MQGVRGGKEGTAFKINFLPLFKEVEPSSCNRILGGETRFLFGERTLTLLTSLKDSLRILGVSSSMMSYGFVPPKRVPRKHMEEEENNGGPGEGENSSVNSRFGFWYDSVS